MSLQATSGRTDSEPIAVLVALLQRVAKQDREAFAAFYRASSAKVYGIIIRLLGRGARADEVMQDVYLRVWQRAGDFDATRASPITWIAAIARNRAIDELRRNAREPSAALPEDFDIAGEDEDPLRGRERQEALRALLACLGGLDMEKREMILLAYYHGVSRDALAARFGHPVATVKTWLRRSLAQLKACLST